MLVSATQTGFSPPALTTCFDAFVCACLKILTHLLLVINKYFSVIELFFCGNQLVLVPFWGLELSLLAGYSSDS